MQRPPALCPPFWTSAKRRLAAADPIMSTIIRRHPRIALTCRGDAFHTLARSIVGQQISVKAADSVWMRFGTLRRISRMAGSTRQAWRG